MEVFTGVLDISLAKWSEITSLYENELDEQKKKIMSVYQRKISHGHDYHNHNFILRFYRDDNGHADLSKIPRLYVIDFDKAQLN